MCRSCEPSCIVKEKEGEANKIQPYKTKRTSEETNKEKIAKVQILRGTLLQKILNYSPEDSHRKFA